MNTFDAVIFSVLAEFENPAFFEKTALDIWVNCFKTHDAVMVEASVPLAEMFGYATDLRSFTQGRGNYTMQFDRYEPVPKSIKEEIIKKNGVK